MERQPKFHSFEGLGWDYDDVLPGDLGVAPGTIAFKFFENGDSYSYTLTRSPFLVLSVIVSKYREDGRLYVYYLLTHHGILLTIRIRDGASVEVD
jgi:hypothetical protein